MASLSNMYLTKKVLETLLETLEKKGEKGVWFDISISDAVNDYGQNLTAYVSQTKEQREEKKARYYVGNGRVFWTDGKIVSPPKEAAKDSVKADDLPF